MRGRRAALVVLAALAGGCSLSLDFDATECSSDMDCPPDLVCQQKLCVARTPNRTVGDGVTAGETGAPDATPDATLDVDTPPLLAGQCTKLYGVANESEVGEIVIGTLMPSTGSLGSLGIRIDQAVELAVEDINQAGGIFGKKIAVVSCDTATDKDKAVEAAQHLAAIGVQAVVGAAASSNTIEVFNEVAKAAGMLMISPASSSPSITDLPDNGLLWRTVPSDAIQGAAIAAYLKEQKFNKVAVVNRNDTYGNAFQLAIQGSFCGSDGSGCTTENYTTALSKEETLADDQAAAILKLNDFKPDIVVLIGFVDDGIAFLNLAAQNGHKRFVITDGMKDGKLVTDVTDTELRCGLLGTNPAQPSGATYKTFEIRYLGKYGGSEPGVFTAHAYDATYLLAYAIAGTGKVGRELKGQDIAAQLRRFSEPGASTVKVGAGSWNATIQQLASNPDSKFDFDGASGPLDFDNDTGEPKLGSIEGWRLDLDKGSIQSLGVIYEADGTYNGFTATAPATGPCVAFRTGGGT